uniref:Uncharacterized protein n=1 Tax=Craspedostauros australis TaxID=1486917 RepID=A0A7R9WRP7_9STRA
MDGSLHHTQHSTRSHSSIRVRGSEVPKSTDVCFEDEDHPGTITFLQAVRNVLLIQGEQEYDPRVYRGIKIQLKGRRYFVSIDGKSLDQWREVKKTELMDVMWNYYEETKAAMEPEDYELDD